MSDVTLTVSLADLQELDKGALAELLKAEMRTGSIDGARGVRYRVGMRC